MSQENDPEHGNEPPMVHEPVVIDFGHNNTHVAMRFDRPIKLLVLTDAEAVSTIQSLIGALEALRAATTPLGRAQ